VPDTHPIEGQVVLLAGARASVPLDRLSDLLATVHAYVSERRERYDRQFERVDAGDTVYYLAGEGHWTAVADDLGLTEREAGAVRRTHETQFLRDGRRLDRTDEFEAALDIRRPVVVA